MKSKKALGLLVSRVQVGSYKEEMQKCFHIVNEAIIKAQKQEKLLELYKKLSNLYETLYSMELSLLSLNSNYYEIEIIKLKQQIKELEND